MSFKYIMGKPKEFMPSRCQDRGRVSHKSFHITGN